ncbi:MAG: oligosaccharide flippase family protein [Patescibacteria group bacterium]
MNNERKNMRIFQQNWHPTTMAKRLWLHFLNDSQFRNSTYIILATAVMSAFGFVFWIIASRLYTPAEIGLATSLISVTSLLTTFSLFGLNNVIIRFLPTSSDRNRLISTALVVTSLGSVLTGILFLLWAHVVHNPVIQLGAFSVVAPIFIALIFLQTTGIILDSVFVAERNAKYILFKNSLFSIAKIALPFLFFALGSIGIIYSITIAALLAWLAGLFWVIIIINFKFIFFKIKALTGMRRFATGNYLGNLFGALPTSLLPLIIVSRLGAQEAAYFYMPMMIITLINVIPSANAQSLFAEASNNEKELAAHLRKALRYLFLVLTPAVITVGIFGHLILGFFGPEYTETGTRVLQILAIASFIGSLNYFGDTVLNIKKFSGLYVGMNAFNALTIVLLAYFAAPLGLVAIALAFLASQILTLLVYIVINRSLIKKMIAYQRTTS